MYSLTFICLLYAICVCQLPFGSCSPDDNSRKNFVAVMDAATAETVLWVFEFEHMGDNQKLKVHELFREVKKPGLRNYTDDPQKCLKGLQELIADAKKQVPAHKWGKTHIIVKITGLGGLPDNVSTVLTDTVQGFLYKTGLHVDRDSLTPMRGRMKVYNWLGINYLLGRLDKSSELPTVPVLSLGVEAAHEALVPTNSTVLTPGQEKRTTNMTIFGRDFHVAGVSIEGLGLYEARVFILGQGRDTETNIYRSICIHPGIVGTWWFHGVLHTYEGSTQYGSSFNFTACLELIKKIVRLQRKGIDLEGGDIYGMMYYHQAAVESGLTKQGKNVTVTVDQIRHKAKEICEQKNPTRPLLCMDMCFINVMLRKAYGLKGNTSIHIVTRLKSIKLSWTLGAAFEWYEKQINKLPKA